MTFRAIALTLAVPLVLVAGTACRTSSSQTRGTETASTSTSESERTASTEQGGTPAETDPNARVQSPSRGDTGQTTPGTVPSGSDPASPSASGTASSDTSGTASGSAGAGTGTTSGDTGASGSSSGASSGMGGSMSSPSTGSDTSGTASGSMGTGSTGAHHDPMMHPGSDVKAHASDEVVSGRISKVSRSSVELESSDGQKKTLQLVPQTAIRVDGQDAQRSELKEGQEVRASFNKVDGKDVAVEIQAGQHGTSGSTGTGSSGSMGTGSSGSMSEPGGSGRSGSDPDAASGTTGDPSTTEPKPAGSSDTKRLPGG